MAVPVLAEAEECPGALSLGDHLALEGGSERQRSSSLVPPGSQHADLGSHVLHKMPQGTGKMPTDN